MCNRHAAAREPTPARRHRGRTGAGATSAGDTNAALPDAEAQAGGPGDLGHTDIDALGKHGSRLDGRPELFKRYSGDIQREEGHMRVAHVGRHGIAERAMGKALISVPSATTAAPILWGGCIMSTSK